jgi:predicted outer membrane protein
MSKIYMGSVALLMAISCASIGIGQQTESRAPQNREESGRTTGQTQIDRPMVEFLASKLVLCNNDGIKMGQMAASKAKNSEVKQFAEMLAKDHAKFNEQLKPFVASYSSEPVSLAADRVTANKPAVAGKDSPAIVEKTASSKIPTQTDTSLRVGDQAALQRLYEISQAAHENHMAACKEMLMTKSGTEFDKGFVGFQMVGHMMLSSELKALESRSTKEFQSVIREISKSVDGHMQKAMSICKTLDGHTEKTEKTETSDR